MSEEATATDLITIPHKNDVPALFSEPGGIESLVKRIEKEARSYAVDISTAKGRKEVKSLAARVSRSKTLIDEVGKEQNEEAQKIIKANNALRNLAKERLDALRDEIKSPVVEWEEAEAERVRKHMVAMDAFALDRVTGNSESAEIQGTIDNIEGIEIGPAWEEFEADAREAKAAALDKFKADLDIAKAREAQAEELEALRAEKVKREQEEAERAAKEAAEREEREREQRAAEQAKAAAAEAERKAREEAEAAEARHKQELAESERRAEEAAKAERDRIAAEKRAEEEAAQKRAADRKYRLKIRAEIVESIVALKAENYEEIVDGIMAGYVRHVKVVM